MAAEGDASSCNEGPGWEVTGGRLYVEWMRCSDDGQRMAIWGLGIVLGEAERSTSQPAGNCRSNAVDRREGGL